MIPEEMFRPRSVAIIGASSDEKKERIGWLGRLQEFGYQGQLYPINPRSSRILGCQAYSSIREVPEPVDYAIVAVRAELVPQVLSECVGCKVKVVHIYTAGFAETGKEKGRKLQEELQAIMQGGTTRVIGPNCMGVYCPGGGLTFNVRFSRKGGAVGVISQTGAGLQGFIPQAHDKGIYFSKVISYGNGVDLEAADLLEYLADDCETHLVFCYIEGLRDGRRFFEAAKRCAENNKPLIILKGGMTQGGREAVVSHTASLAGLEQVWRGFFKQARCISVETLEEALEQILAFQYLRPPKGKAVAIITRGGGPGVIATDQCEKSGLSVPALSKEIRSALETIVQAEAGSSVRNPVEIGLGRSGVSQHYADGIKLAASDPHIDMLLVQLNPHFYAQYGVGAERVEEAVGTLVNTAKEVSKPMAVVIPLGDDLRIIDTVLKAHKKCLSEGLAAFSDVEKAVKAMSKLAEYWAPAERNTRNR
ncbi:MAG TPA: hypothetical protein EYP71_06135 [Dehalococcoidia bacterium]|nr:hypothetical protein [Dehalococcoidia bacterium]